MAEEDTKSVAVPGNAGSGGSSSGKTNANGKPSFSDTECDNNANRESSPSVNNIEHSRRYTTGKPISPKITPHYLLASTGSCHDNCKYGLKPDFEEKEKRPWIRRFAVSSLRKQNGVVTVTPTELKKSPLSRSISFPVNLSHLLQHEASSDAMSSPHRHKIIKGKIMQPQKTIEGSLKQDPASDRRMPKKGKGITDDSGEQSPSVMRRTSSRNSLESGHYTHKAEKKLNHSSEKISPPLHSQQVKAKLSRSMQAAGSIKETAAISKETLKSSKIVSKIPYSIQTSRGANGSRKTRDDKKISKANTKLSPSSLTERTVMERGLKGDDVLTRKNMAPLSSSAKKTSVSPGSSPSSKPSIGRKTTMKPRNVGRSKPVSSVKDQNKTLQKDIKKNSDEHVPEKTLHVVAIETKAKLSDSTEVEDIIPLLPELNLSLDLPCLSSHEEVGGGGREVVVVENNGHMEDEVKREAEEKEEGEEEHTGEDEVEQQGDEKGQQQLEDEEMEMDEEGDYDDDDEEEEEEEEDDKDEENEYESDEGDESVIDNKTVNYDDLSAGNICKPLKKGHTVSESEDSMQVKLKFIEGKILEIDSENKVPRRLRFRRGRIVEANGINNETRRRNFNKRHNSKANSNNTKEQKIVLRHQDLEEKKDDQGLLLNNVIEETASKLAESRKSKVKALVGAFETVISRHDSKPARR